MCVKSLYFLSDKVITIFLLRREIKINLPLHDANTGYFFGPFLIVLSAPALILSRKHKRKQYLMIGALIDCFETLKCRVESLSLLTTSGLHNLSCHSVNYKSRSQKRFYFLFGYVRACFISLIILSELYNELKIKTKLQQKLELF